MLDLNEPEVVFIKVDLLFVLGLENLLVELLQDVVETLLAGHCVVRFVRRFLVDELVGHVVIEEGQNVKKLYFVEMSSALGDKVQQDGLVALGARLGWQIDFVLIEHFDELCHVQIGLESRTQLVERVLAVFGEENNAFQAEQIPSGLQVDDFQVVDQLAGVRVLGQGGHLEHVDGVLHNLHVTRTAAGRYEVDDNSQHLNDAAELVGLFVKRAQVVLEDVGYFDL